MNPIARLQATIDALKRQRSQIQLTIAFLEAAANLSEMASWKAVLQQVEAVREPYRRQLLTARCDEHDQGFAQGVLAGLDCWSLPPSATTTQYARQLTELDDKIRTMENRLRDIES